ncbi:MAG: nitroreductase family protein [Bulleidia sp.]
MELMEVIRNRHSVRQYDGRVLTQQDQQKMQACIDQINAQSGLQIQLLMDDSMNGIFARAGGFHGCRNVLAAVGPKGKTGELLCGYYGQQAVLKAQEIGLHTCWVALTKGKTTALIPEGKTCIALIAIGYGLNEGKPHRSKPMEQLYESSGPVPQWFLDGVEAAMYAPTANNQQKFRFVYQEDQAYLKILKGPYSNIDAGIVRYHFEAVSGHEVTVL